MIYLVDILTFNANCGLTVKYPRVDTLQLFTCHNVVFYIRYVYTHMKHICLQKKIESHETAIPGMLCRRSAVAGNAPSKTELFLHANGKKAPWRHAMPASFNTQI